MRTTTQRLLCILILPIAASRRTVSCFSPPTRITAASNSRRDDAALHSSAAGSIFFDSSSSPSSSSSVAIDNTNQQSKQQQQSRKKLLTATIAGYLTFLLQKLTWDTLTNAVTSTDCTESVLNNVVVAGAPSSKYTIGTTAAAAALSLLAFVKMILTTSSSIPMAFSSATSWYLRRLEAAPLITKCITGGIISFLGDYGAQWFEFAAVKNRSSSGSHDSCLENHHQNVMMRETSVTEKKNTADSVIASPRAGDQNINNIMNNNKNRYSNRLSIHGTYNIRRGLARFLECLLISSPLMHYGYDLFEKIIPTTTTNAASGGLNACLAAMSHVLADSVFLDGIFVMTGIIATGLLEGHSLKRVLPNLRNVYVPTLKASVVTSSALMPLQFLSFRFAPVQLRVLSVNAVDLIWTGVVSFVSHSDVGKKEDGER